MHEEITNCLRLISSVSKKNATFIAPKILRQKVLLVLKASPAKQKKSIGATVQRNFGMVTKILFCSLAHRSITLIIDIQPAPSQSSADLNTSSWLSPHNHWVLDAQNMKIYCLKY